MKADPKMTRLKQAKVILPAGVEPTSLIIGRPARKQRNEESTILHGIRQALAREPSVICWRNNTGVLPDQRGIPVSFGLCEGSADLIGIVMVACTVHRDVLDSAGNLIGRSTFGSVRTLGRMFAIEVKKPGKRPTDEQFAFLDLVRGMGGAATWVTSVDEALAFIESARRGE